jgi:hypothetical protein
VSKESGVSRSGEKTLCEIAFGGRAGTDLSTSMGGWPSFFNFAFAAALDFFLLCAINDS